VNHDNSSRVQRCQTQLRDFLEEAMREVPIERIMEPAIAGKWSANEHLAHLGRYHEIFLQRIDRILAEPCPEFERYRAEDDPQWESWRCLAYKEVAEKLAGLREMLIVKLKSLTPEDYARTGFHPAFGEMTLAVWLEFFLVHEGHHLYAVLGQLRASR
jgi:hypothetical protein